MASEEKVDSSRLLNEPGAGEPIAVVGMACRFPSATGLPAFWRQLEASESAVIARSDARDNAPRGCRR